MPTITNYLAALTLTIACGLAQAAEEKTALIEELLELSHAEELTKTSQLEGFKAGMAMNPGAIPADKKQAIIDAGERIMEEVMPWETMKQDFIAVYDEHYTLEELRAVVSLCKDPRYQTLVGKQLELVGPSMAIGQKYGRLLMPKIMQATTEIMQKP